MSDQDVPRERVELESLDPKSIDIESLDLGQLARHASPATFASNWKSILATDASLGVVLALIGVAIVIWLGWAGWLLVALGLAYVGLVGRRFLQWRWIRRKVGLR